MGHPQHNRLLAGWDRGEDAALWDLGNGQVAILTVDLITPVTNDPYLWGQVAAANALSDVFAMGGAPRVALNVVAFPVSCEPLETLRAVLEGGRDKIGEAGALLAGGHSLDDEEPKYGLVVFGEGAKDRLWRVSGARPGDGILLTKPLGTGIMITAVKAGLASAEEQEALEGTMATLNDLPRRLPDSIAPALRACTDVTGFGFAGHLLDMVGESLDGEVDLAALPLLPGVMGKSALGLVPAGCYRNREAFGGRVREMRKYDAHESDILFDPQTSGGLLLAVDPAAEDAVAALIPGTRRVGRFVEGSGGLMVR